MSGIVVITPILVGAAWPAVISAASAVMVAMGYAALKSTNDVYHEETTTVQASSNVEVELSNSEEIGQSVGREEELVFTQGEVTVKFSRDVRGKLKICVDGPYGKRELEEFGRELAGRVIQQYAYNRIVEEVRQKSGMSLVEQSVDEDSTIRIKLRSWEE